MGIEGEHIDTMVSLASIVALWAGYRILRKIEYEYYLRIET